MAIWLDGSSRILVQGMTGSEGTKHTRRMVASGANVVAGVTPGKAGQDLDGIPIFNSVGDAMAAQGVVPDVVHGDRHDAGLPGALQDAVIEHADEHVGEQREDVEMQHSPHSLVCGRPYQTAPFRSQETPRSFGLQPCVVERCQGVGLRMTA